MAEKHPGTSGMFAFQGSLPRLPVLPLGETLRKFLDRTALLLDAQDRHEAEGAVLSLKKQRRRTPSLPARTGQRPSA
ncbi:hypothetical protein [Aminivibrio sp.]|uniref:hypothetical protein n=1 Tax=Aminivibrio sp. TaxID=1872489 RepID=UPI001A5E9B18|nr:hypothetical protein [Aminivibrio sp.]MBL3540201.1 hypothetical protein [Aminivibrio sp.]